MTSTKITDIQNTDTTHVKLVYVIYFNSSTANQMIVFKYNVNMIIRRFQIYVERIQLLLMFLHIFTDCAGKITDCTSCTMNGATVECTACGNSKEPSSTSTSCVGKYSHNLTKIMLKNICLKKENGIH